MDELTRLGEFLPRLVWEIIVASLCGGVIGMERRLRRVSPHLNLYVLTCLGSALVMTGGELMMTLVNDAGGSLVNLFASLTLVWIILAVAIKGYFKTDFGPTDLGLLWMTGLVGAFIGLGYTLWGLFLMGATVLVVSGVQLIERRIAVQLPPQILRVTVKQESTQLRELLKKSLEEVGAVIETFRSESLPFGVRITLTIASPPPPREKLLSSLWVIPEITEVEF